MIDKFIATALFLVFCLGIMIGFPDGLIAIALVTILSTFFVLMFQRFTEEKKTVTRIFLIALSLRMLFGIFIHSLSFREFFGGDANTYHANGMELANVWLNGVQASERLIYYISSENSIGWGMSYLVAGIYVICGKNIFAAQSFCAVFGAATAPLVFFCSRNIYNNLSVAKIAGYSVAIFPAFVIWSGQLLKDGLIIFLLVSAMILTMQLSKKFSPATLLLLVSCLFGVMSLRFYIFYMVTVAVVGSYVVGLSKSTSTILFRFFLIVGIGVFLTYFGAIDSISSELMTFGSLERIQRSRADLATRSDSGFGEDLDVSTAEGALSTLPIGFSYLMLAPFPWQAVNLRQAITIPEVIVWWMLIPFILLGLFFTIKNRSRAALPILIFSLLLTIGYSLFQGNMGTAYRQRTQIQVFLFIFCAVGWTVFKEHKENKRLIMAARRREIESRLRSSLQPRQT